MLVGKAFAVCFERAKEKLTPKAENDI